MELDSNNISRCTDLSTGHLVLMSSCSTNCCACTTDYELPTSLSSFVGQTLRETIITEGLEGEEIAY